MHLIFNKPVTNIEHLYPNKKILKSDFAELHFSYFESEFKKKKYIREIQILILENGNLQIYRIYFVLPIKISCFIAWLYNITNKEILIFRF